MRAVILAIVLVAGCQVDAPTYVDPDAGGGRGDGRDGDPAGGPTILVDPDQMTVPEGGQAVVRVRLSAPPPGDAVITIAPGDGARLRATPGQLTFTAASWQVDRVVTLLAAEDDDADDQQVAVVLDGGGVVGDAGAVVAISDDDQLRMIVAPAGGLQVGEGQQAPVHVRLSARPPAPVTIAVSASTSGVMSFAPASVTIAPDAWDRDQTITVSAGEDADTADDVVRLSLVTDRPELPDHTLDVTVIDDDVLNLQATPGNLGTLAEGGPARALAVKLTRQPPGPVAVTLSASPGGVVRLSPSTLYFDRTSWATAQTVMVAAADDADADDEVGTITLAAPGLTSRTVALAVADDDVQRLVASPAQVAGLVEATSATVQVRLDAEPAGPVVVDVTSLDPARVAVEPATLTFTPASYASAQPVRVRALPDADLASGETIVRLHATSDGLTLDLPVAYVDDDVQALVVSADALAVGEGGAVALSVHLAHEPAAPLAVTIATSDPGAVAVTPTTLTFTPADFAVDQAVAVRGVDDADAGDEAGTVSLTAPGVAPVTVAVAVADDDAQTLVVSPAGLAVTEGGAGTLTVRLGARPDAPVTVAIAVDPAGALAVSPPTLAFDPASWDTPQPVTVSAPHDDDVLDATATLRLSAGGLVRSVPVTIDDDDVLVPRLAPAALTLAEGERATVAVRLSNDPGGTVTVSAVRVGDDLVDVGPAQLTFTEATWDQPQQVEVSARVDPDDVGGTTTIRFTTGAGASADLAVTVTDVTMLVGFRPPHEGEPGTTEQQLRAFAVTAPTDGPGCLRLDELEVVVAGLPAEGPAQVRVALYQRGGGPGPGEPGPDRLVHADPPRTVTLGLNRFALAAEVPVRWPLWLAVEASDGVSLATGAAEVGQCGRGHAVGQPLPERFGEGGGRRCEPRRPYAVWLIARPGTGCP